MARRSYHQYCPITLTLDIVGERWTLLVIRELYFGPRRFTDILKGLPGIGANLLSQRLKYLEQTELIQQRKLPPPAASTVYELTESGAALKDVLRMLAKNGFRYLQTCSPADAFIGVIPAMLAVENFFSPVKASSVEIVCELHISGEIFFADIRHDQIEVGQRSLKTPDLVVHTTPEILAQLLVSYRQLSEVLEEDGLQIKVGSRSALVNFLGCYDAHESNLNQQ
ncbi:MAG: helix-turn-helix domain-containing protein [Chloroflexota bacterium]